MTDGKTGTLIPREEVERWERQITVARRYGLSEALATRLRQYKFRSVVQTERVQAATRLLEAERQFMDVYHEHQLSYQRLLSVHEKARRHEEIERLQEENLILQLRNEQNGLFQAAKDAGGMTCSDFQDEVGKSGEKARLDAAKRAAQAKAKIEARRDVCRERDAIKAELLRDAGGGMTPELERELQNIDDAYQEVLDSL